MYPVLFLGLSLSPLFPFGLEPGHVLYQQEIKRLFLVILSGAKNLSFKAAEILRSAALRSE